VKSTESESKSTGSETEYTDSCSVWLHEHLSTAEHVLN